MDSTLGRALKGIMPARPPQDNALAAGRANIHFGLILTIAGQNDLVDGDSHQQPSTATSISYTFLLLSIAYILGIDPVSNPSIPLYRR